MEKKRILRLDKQSGNDVKAHYAQKEKSQLLSKQRVNCQRHFLSQYCREVKRNFTSVNYVVLVAPVNGSDQLVDVAAHLLTWHTIRQLLQQLQHVLRRSRQVLTDRVLHTKRKTPSIFLTRLIHRTGSQGSAGVYHCCH